MRPTMFPSTGGLALIGALSAAVFACGDDAGDDSKGQANDAGPAAPDGGGSDGEAPSSEDASAESDAAPEQDASSVDGGNTAQTTDAGPDSTLPVDGSVGAGDELATS